MSLAPRPDSANLLSTEFECLSKCSVRLLVLGGLLILVGMVAISSSFIATLATVVMLGTLLMIGGVVEIVEALLGRGWRGFWMHLLAGIMYTVLGFLLLQRPLAAAAFFTLMIAASLFIGGLFRIFVALGERFYGWGWVLLNGVISLVLGVLIWQEWPETAFWVIGVFVGIDMLFAGWSLVITAATIRSATAKQVSSPTGVAPAPS
jgi:uncharacterized membrane protein HdeD (DUF308 family)